MTGRGRETGMEAAERGCFSRGSFRESENIAEADLGLPNVGFRIFCIVNGIGYNAHRISEFSLPHRVSPTCIPSQCVGP